MPQVCGFMVVRLPQYVLYGNPPERMAAMDGKVYRGVDRLPWHLFDEMEAEYSIKRDLANKAEHSTLGCGLIHITEDLDLAKEFLALTGAKNEIIAVYSDRLDRMGGSFGCDEPMELMGYEAFALREWSPHYLGVFLVPDAFPEFVPALNRNGLFDTENLCAPLAARYQELAEGGVVEPLGEPADFVALKLFKLA